MYPQWRTTEIIDYASIEFSWEVLMKGFCGVGKGK
jgi:hypothetical protein